MDGFDFDVGNWDMGPATDGDPGGEIIIIGTRSDPVDPLDVGMSLFEWVSQFDMVNEVDLGDLPVEGSNQEDETCGGDEVDGAATDAAGDITSEEGSVENEYGSIVYTDENGVTTYTAPQTSGEATTVDVILPDGISIEQIRAFVHNHPAEVRIDQDPDLPGIQDPIGDATDRANMYPSAGDWQQMEDLVNAGADPSSLSIYIIGPDGVMREFQYTDRATYDIDPFILGGLAEDTLPPPLPGPVEDQNSNGGCGGNEDSSGG